MQEQIQQRLTQLKTEFEEGQKMLADLEAKEANLRSTLLRISGAIQVLEELLAQASAEKGSETIATGGGTPT
jgi:hypothetical protein